MTSPEALARGLLEPLLDARPQPATEHFDEALARALAAGRVTPELARELRFWQRASVHEVTDHVRTVLPVVLPAALSAVAEARQEADQAVAGALEAWAARQDPTMATESEPSAPPAAATSVEQSDPHAASAETVPLDEPSDDAGGGPGPTETPVSTPPRPGAAMSPHLRRRLFVAGLTSTA